MPLSSVFLVCISKDRISSGLFDYQNCLQIAFRQVEGEAEEGVVNHKLQKVLWSQLQAGMCVCSLNWLFFNAEHGSIYVV